VIRCGSGARSGVEGQVLFLRAVRDGEMIEFAGVIQPLAFVIRREEFRYCASKRMGVIMEADNDLMERGGHVDEVYEPQNTCVRAVQSEGNQPREDGGN